MNIITMYNNYVKITIRFGRGDGQSDDQILLYGATLNTLTGTLTLKKYT